MSVIFNNLLEELTNIIESPFLIWEILTILRAGIKGESCTELDNFLQLIATEIGVSENDLEYLSKKYFHAATTDCTNELIAPTVADGTELTAAVTKTELMRIANRIFIKSGFSLNESYRNMLKQKFACGVQELDFSAPRLAAKAINEWVKLATNELIPSIISANDVSADTQAVLANAIYFKAQWRHQFEPADTNPKPFNINAHERIAVPMMSQVMSARYAYLPEHKAKVLELPYRNTDLAMLLILPTELSAMANLSLPDVVKQLVFRKVCVELPKFTFGCTINVHSLLAKFGVRDVFKAPNFEVSKIIQQAFINVTEEGTEAAAATACCIDGASSFEEMFIADRPFYFCIKNINCLKLFEGCYQRPQL